MAAKLIDTMANTAPRDVRLLGVDLGTKTIGLAISDAGHTIATALKTIERKKFATDVASLDSVIQEYEIGGIVFGWPLHMDGQAGAACDRVQSFMDEWFRYPQGLGTELRKTLWIALFDERLSTATVQNFLINDVDMSRTKRDQHVDKLAAQIILSGALEYLSRVKQSS